MAKIVLSVVSLLFSAQLFASAQLDSAPFFKRFEIIRNPKGGVSMIAIKNGEVQFTVAAIIKEIRDDLEFAQRNQIANGPAFDRAMFEMTTVSSDEPNWTPEQRELAQKSYTALMQLDIPSVFENQKFKDTMTKFENKVKAHLIGHKVVANLEDAKYFYSRAVAYKIASFGFDLIRKYLSNVPLVNIASMVVDRAVASIEERRTFHQNMLLFYLERFSPDQLQMTADEVNFAKSSIYESRIAWFMYPESKKAQATWMWYGSDYFGFYRQQADITLENNFKKYDGVGERACFAYQEVTEKGVHKIVNLMDHKFIMSSAPSDAFFYGDAKKVQRQRMLLRLVQEGLQLLPLPNFVRNVFNTFINSMYSAQEKTDGALYGFLESSGQTAQAAVVVKQTLNPYLRSDFGAGVSSDLWELP